MLSISVFIGWAITQAILPDSLLWSGDDEDDEENESNDRRQLKEAPRIM